MTDDTQVTDSVTSAAAVWDAWFDAQYDINLCIDRAVRDLSKDKSDGFQAAIYAGLIEHCAEQIRTFIPDVTLTKDGDR